MITLFIISAFSKVHCENIIQLLKSEQEHSNVTLTKEALSFLRNGKRAHRPVIPIVVAGPTRSGKSMFLGMISGCRKLFPTGDEILHKTRGASMIPWENESQEEDNEKTKPLFLLIDTEGIGNVQNLHDTALLSFSMMASSHFVYHQKENFENSDISQLSKITQMINQLKANGSTISIKLPKLTWILEKFCLKMPMEPKNYLYSELLKTIGNPTKKEKNEDYNEVVRTLRNEFKDQRAFFIPPALNDSSLWKDLSKISENKMELGYLKQIHNVINYLKKTNPIQYFEPLHNMTCEEYALFLKSIMSYVNSDSDSRDVMMKMSREACEKGKETYHSMMEKLKLPENKTEFNIEEGNARLKAYEAFKNITNPDFISSKRELKELYRYFNDQKKKL